MCIIYVCKYLIKYVNIILINICILLPIVINFYCHKYCKTRNVRGY